MSGPPVELADLEQDRSRLYGDLSRVGDFRRGALHAVRRKCGKANCACADPAHPGHGPQYNFTRSVGGKTVNVHLKPGPELDKLPLRAQVQVVLEQLPEQLEAVLQARLQF